MNLMKKGVALLSACSVFALASCGSNASVTEYTVSIPNTNGVIASPNKAHSNSDYKGKISLATDLVEEGTKLPDKLTKVTSGNKELVGDEKSYTYTLNGDRTEADFTIPKENIVGNIIIELSLVTPEPTIKHTLTFVGTDCFMVDDEGEHITEKEFDAGQIASYSLVGKTEEYETPLFNHVDVTYTETGEPFDGTYDYDDDTGEISIKMTDDVTVTARSDKVILTYTEALAWVEKNYETATRTLSGYKVNWDYEYQEPNSNTFPAEFTNVGLYGKDLDGFVQWTLQNAVGVAEGDVTEKTKENYDLSTCPKIFQEVVFNHTFDKNQFTFFGTPAFTNAEFILSKYKDAITVSVTNDSKTIPLPQINQTTSLKMEASNEVTYIIDADGYLESYYDYTYGDNINVLLIKDSETIGTASDLGTPDFFFSVTPVVSQ